MASNTGKACEVCNKEFNEGDRCPRNLPCSHCLCSNCIQKLIATKAKICPFCRQEFQATSTRDIGINKCLLEILKLVKKMEQNTVPPPSPQVTSHSKLVAEMKEQTGKVTGQIIVSLRESKEQTHTVCHMNNTLRNDLLQSNEILQNQILVKIQENITKNAQMVKYLDGLNSRLDMQMVTMKEKENQLEDEITKLRHAETLSQTAVAVEETDAINLASQNWLQTHQELISGNMKAHQTFEKVVKRTSDSLRTFQDGLELLEGEAEEKDLIPDLGLLTVQEDVPLEITVIKRTRDSCLRNFKDGLELLEGEAGEKDFIPDLGLLTVQVDVPLEITTESLREKTEPVLDMIRKGKVFSFQELEGRRFARISLDEKNRICLHYLTEQALPADAQLLKHSDVLELMDVSSRMVFLELYSNEKKTLGKLYIRLFPESKRAQQFALLCTAEKSPTYVGSHILWADSPYAWCGDYENLRGKGGKALVPDVWMEEGGVFKRPHLAGTIRGWWSGGGEAKAAQFWIITRDWPGRELDCCFGMVEEGLPILQEAIDCHSDITKVIFSDAGIVLNI